MAAYKKESNLDRAIGFCQQTSPEEQFACLSQLFDLVIVDDLEEAEILCQQYLEQDKGDCLRSLALKWAKDDHQRAVSLCKELDPDDVRGFGCVLDVALMINVENPELAKEICGQLRVEEAGLCRRELSQ
jgi:hypothetical protein